MLCSSLAEAFVQNGNLSLIRGVCSVFILLLCVWIVLNGVRRSQGGQEYAKRLEARELEKFAESEKGTKKTEGAKASNAKKDQ